MFECEPNTVKRVILHHENVVVVRRLGVQEILFNSFNYNNADIMNLRASVTVLGNISEMKLTMIPVLQ